MKKKVLSEKFLKYVFIFLMSIVFTTRYVDYNISMRVQCALAILIIILTYLTGFHKDKKSVEFILKYYFLPSLIIHLYSIFMIVLGVFDSTYLVTNLTTYIPIFLVISILEIYGKDSIKASLISIICSWSFSVILSLLVKGPGIFIYAINQAYFNNYTIIWGVSKNYLELHDLVLSIGLLLIFYVFNIKKIDKKVLTHIIPILIIFIFGMKRISILGFIAVFFVFYILKNKNDEFKHKFIKYSGIAAFILCILYVYLIFNDVLLDILTNKLNINMMGRNYYFRDISKLGRFSITYLGIGRNSIARLLQTSYSYLRVGGVHCDLLKMYIENGFILYCLWLWYYLIKLPKIYYEKFGTKASYLYFLLTIYTFILYLTDNVENYFIYQFLFILIPYCYTMFNGDDVYEKENNIIAK